MVKRTKPIIKIDFEAKAFTGSNPVVTTFYNINKIINYKTAHRL